MVVGCKILKQLDSAIQTLKWHSDTAPSLLYPQLESAFQTESDCTSLSSSALGEEGRRIQSDVLGGYLTPAAASQKQQRERMCLGMAFERILNRVCLSEVCVHRDLSVSRSQSSPSELQRYAVNHHPRFSRDHRNAYILRLQHFLDHNPRPVVSFGGPIC